MKTLIYFLKRNTNFLFFLVVLMTPVLSRAQQQCLEPKFEDNCSGLISSIFEDYLYLHSRAFSSKESVDVKFQVTLKRNILYIFNVCGIEGDKTAMVLKLYDSNNKVVSSSINDKTKVNNKILIFKPEAAGKYYVSTVFEENKSTCCLVLFGMISKNIEQYYNMASYKEKHLNK